MAKFFYIARDSAGKKLTGSDDASTQEELVNKLQSKGLIVVSVIPQQKQSEETGAAVSRKRKRFQLEHNRVTSEDLTFFCRQLATLLGAGVTILKSLSIISQQVSSRRLLKIIGQMQKDMEGGLSLHEAMAKHSRIFSELWVNLVESGEASGNLAIILTRLAVYLERNAAFRSKVVSALMYPAILLVAGLVALLFMTVKIVPVFAEIFKGFNIELPALTKLLIFVSNFIRTRSIIIIIVSAILIFLFKKYIQTGEGRKQYETLKFNLPVLGQLSRSMMVERFSSEMSTLVESGVPILYSLDIAEHSMGNMVMADIIRDIKDDVRSGKSLSKPLERSGFFDPMVVQMVAIGEEIGELPQMFKKINAFYQEYVETFLTRFTSMFEPMMLIFIGLIIGIMVIGMFMPIFQIAKFGG